ncbi:MAG TPA: TIGR03086 family metal-binding protein [Acidimicrobiales bacterium]
MSEISERYARRAAAFTDKVAAVPDDGWSAPTPCEEWTARDIVRHVVDSQGMFLGFVGQEMGDLPSVDDDPLAAVQAATGRILGDLEDSERAAATFDGFMGTSTFEAGVNQFLAADLVIHGWDLARATGQDDAVAAQDLAELQEAVKLFPEEAMRGPGAFGPEVEVGDDASDQDKLLAFLGRRP